MLARLYGRALGRSPSIISQDQALPGRDAYAYDLALAHAVNGTPMRGPWPDTQALIFGMGCFWGAERTFWQLDGVVNTSVGYAAGHTPFPTYREVCTGQTGHNEVVRVVFAPHKISLDQLLKVFWEGHDPTQGMRQGNDRGTQYRSGIYVASNTQADAARASLAAFQTQLSAAGFGSITTEICPVEQYYLAEVSHQQYLAKNPGGYCGLGGTGVSCPVGVGVEG